MKKISEKLTNKCIEAGLVEDYKKEWCRYIIEKQLLTIAGNCIIASAGIINGYLIETIIFMASFILMRERTGGYHAEHPCTCLAISLFIALSLPLGIKALDYLSRKQVIAFVFGGFMVNFCLSPVNHPNMKMTEHELKANKRFGIINYLCLSITSFLSCILLSTKISNSIIYGILLAAGSVMIAKILKQEVNYGTEG